MKVSGSVEKERVSGNRRQNVTDDLRLATGMGFGRVPGMKLVHQVSVMNDIVNRLPFRYGITDPLDLVLEATIAETGVDNLFDLKLVFSTILNRLGWRGQAIEDIIGNIGFQEGYLKD